jgi:hypothetical protein
MVPTWQRPGEDGFPVAYCSDADGVRYAIVDPADADMSGWSVERVDTRGRVSRSEFTRDDIWFGGEGGAWNGLGYGTPSKPWSALVDHGERITAWIPPSPAPPRRVPPHPGTATSLGAVDAGVPMPVSAIFRRSALGTGWYVIREDEEGAVPDAPPTREVARFDAVQSMTRSRSPRKCRF